MNTYLSLLSLPLLFNEIFSFEHGKIIHLVIYSIFIEHLACARVLSRHWNLVVNKTHREPCRN